MMYDSQSLINKTHRTFLSFEFVESINIPNESNFQQGLQKAEDCLLLWCLLQPGLSVSPLDSGETPRGMDQRYLRNSENLEASHCWTHCQEPSIYHNLHHCGRRDSLALVQHQGQPKNHANSKHNAADTLSKLPSINRFIHLLQLPDMVDAGTGQKERCEGTRPRHQHALLFSLIYRPLH